MAPAKRTQVHPDGALGGPSPRAPAPHRQLLAACLLIASLLVPAVGTVTAMNGWTWGLGERYYLMAWSMLQLAATPIGNVLALWLGDRSKLWVKLNYVVIAFWIVISALLWAFSRFVVITK